MGQFVNMGQVLVVRKMPEVTGRERHVSSTFLRDNHVCQAEFAELQLLWTVSHLVYSCGQMWLTVSVLAWPELFGLLRNQISSNASKVEPTEYLDVFELSWDFFCPCHYSPGWGFTLGFNLCDMSVLRQHLGHHLYSLPLHFGIRRVCLYTVYLGISRKQQCWVNI